MSANQPEGVIFTRFADGNDALEGAKALLCQLSASPLLKNKFVKDSWCHQPELHSRPKQKLTEPNPQEPNPVSQAYVTVACGQLLPLPPHRPPGSLRTKENQLQPLEGLQQLEEQGEIPRSRSLRGKVLWQEQILRQP